MGNIRIKETIIDSASDFNIKRFRIGNLSVEGPIKTIDAKNIIKYLFDLQKKSFEKIILETSKTFKSDSIQSILNESNSYRIKDYFNFKEWYSSYPNFLTPTFDFNPYICFKKIDNISGFFDYYYNYSDLALFVPNINFQKGIYKENKKGKLRMVGKEQLITLNQYLNFVDEAYELLNFKNKKSIFVPLSLKMDMKSIEKVANHYLKKEYTNVWVDYQASTTTNKAKSALLRHFNRKFKENERLEELILHSTNIKREIIAHNQDDISPSSDILASILGSNIIGSNRSPPVPRSSNETPLTEEKMLAFKEHKARVFYPDSYYYVKIDKSKYGKERKKLLMDTRFNILFNSSLLNIELKNQTDYFLKDIEIKRYISKKKMIKEYQQGKLLDLLFITEKKIDETWY